MSKQKWDAIYQQSEKLPGAAWVLQQNRHLLPKQGRALDLACGLGGNALLLAEAGLEVDAWDISSVAITQLQHTAASKLLTINAVCGEANEALLAPESYDVITVSYFLQRDLCGAISAALKPGGLLFYQTYCRVKVQQTGPNNPDYLLADNELLQLFPALKLRVYREESLLGDQAVGLRNQALMVAERP